MAHAGWQEVDAPSRTANIMTVLEHKEATLHTY